MRSILLPEEQKRVRALGALCAQAMDAAIRAVKPGMTEYEIAALAAYESERRGVQAVVNLIATDERIFKYRHPLPANKKLEKYADDRALWAAARADLFDHPAGTFRQTP